MDITPFRNIINEMYAKDTSRKIKSALHARKMQGKYMATTAPFGYQKDEKDHNHLVIDEVTAPVVELIFSIAEEGVRIENLYAKLYEDLTGELLTEKRFQMLSARYDSEQEELTAKIKELEKSAIADREQLSSIEQFAEQISGYAGITELNFKIINQLIEIILVSEPVEVDGQKIQRLTIHYKFIGALETLE